jgi:predicted small metal-binding protein
MAMPYSADLKQVCGCGMTVQETTKEELVSKVKQHALDKHGIREVPPELGDKLARSIHEE